MMRTLRAFSWLALPALAVTAGAQGSPGGGAAVAPARVQGISANITMTLQPPAVGASVGRPSTFSGTAVFANGQGRVDIARGEGPSLDFRAGDYVLLPDAARVVYLRATSQEFWNMDSPFLSPYADLLARAAGQISATGGTTRLERLGAGDSIGTFATERFRIEAEYTVGAGGMSIPAGVSIELTIARTPVKFAGAPLAGAQTFGLASSSALTSRVAGHLAEIAAEGLIVRANSSSWFSFQGTSVETVVTTTLSDLKLTEVDAARLAMPTGFKPGT